MVNEEYHNYRDSIQSGDLLAWSERGWSSWHDLKVQMVRMFTRSEYSHVGIAWVVSGRVFVIEAVMPKVRIYPLSKLGSFYHVPLNMSWSRDVEEFAISTVGEEYSQLSALKAFFKAVNRDEVDECASLAIAIANRARINLGTRATPDAVVRKALTFDHALRYVENE